MSCGGDTEMRREGQLVMCCGIHRDRDRERKLLLVLCCSLRTILSIGSWVTDSAGRSAGSLPGHIPKVLKLMHQFPRQHLFTSFFI